MQAAGSAIDAGIGMILGNYNDRRQLKQQDKLTQQQLAAQKDMLDYSKEKDFEMWQRTNYKAQMAELAKAGLNPALLYGMKGGGGVTTGGGSPAIAGGKAPEGGHEIQDLMGMGMQRTQIALQAKMTEAQVENIKADTAQKQAETTKTTGVDTAKTQSEIDKLAQETDNERLKYDLMNVDLGLKHLEQRLGNETIDQAIETAKVKLQQLQSHLRQDLVNAHVAEATQTQVINEVTARVAKTWAEAALAKSNITVNEEQKKLIMQQVDHLMNDTALAYGKNKQEALKVAIDLYKAQIGAAAIPMENMTKILEGVIDILILRKLVTPTPRGTVEGFGRGNNH